MNLEILISDARKNKFTIIKAEDLEELLSHSKILIEKETHLSDKIRLLKINETLIIQEKSDKGEIIIREISTINAAEDFIKERLEIYDRMWDGCGCKVEYYS